MKKILQNFSDLVGKTVTDVKEGYSVVDGEEELTHIAIHTEDSILVIDTDSKYSIERDTQAYMDIVRSIPHFQIDENLIEQLGIV